MTGEGTGHTEDLGKPSAIREDQKGIKQEEDKSVFLQIHPEHVPELDPSSTSTSKIPH